MEDLALSTSSHKLKRKKGLFIACIVTRHKKRMAKGCFDVQKSKFCEITAFSPQFFLYMDKDMLIRGKCKFLLELP